MKRLLMLALGILFLLFGVAVGLFTIGYLTEGAGFQFLGFLSSLTVLFGWIQVTGLLLLSGFSLLLGIYWCAEAAVKTEKS
jgi:hypothetical protein